MSLHPSHLQRTLPTPLSSYSHSTALSFTNTPTSFDPPQNISSETHFDPKMMISRESALRGIKQYGPGVALAIALFSHFQRRKKKPLTTLESLVYTFRSSTFRNLVLSAGFVAWFSKHLFGMRAKRTFPLFFFTIWGLIYQYRVIETPKVWFHRTYWNTHIVEKSKISKTAFHPVYWAFNRHAQTITCYLISAIEWLWSDPIVYTREEIPSYDGVNVQFLDHAGFREDGEGESAGVGKETLPIVLCIHGLGDHREIPYIKRFARMCLKSGWRAVVWSYWRFDFEDSRDLHLVVEHLQRSNPGEWGMDDGVGQHWE